MVQWIMEFISTLRLSININGELNGYFLRKKGSSLRELSLSPYIFSFIKIVILIVEISLGACWMPKFRKGNFNNLHGVGKIEFPPTFALLTISSSFAKETDIQCKEFSGVSPNLRKSSLLIVVLTAMLRILYWEPWVSQKGLFP